MGWKQEIQGMAYVAIPYTGTKGQDCPMEEREQSFNVANKIAAYFLNQGEVVYSPITHSHPIHFYMNGMGNDHDLWMKYDKFMAEYCNRLYVVCYGEWKQSKGVQQEMEWFKRDKKPVFLIAILENLRISIAYPVGDIGKELFDVPVYFPYTVKDRKKIVDLHERKMISGIV